MTDVPIVKICVAPEQQNNVFDARVTGVKNPNSLNDLRTQLEAASYTWLTSGREAEGVYVCTLGCASGNLLTDDDIPLITRAIEASGMTVIE